MCVYLLLNVYGRIICVYIDDYMCVCCKLPVNEKPQNNWLGLIGCAESTNYTNY